ncbi:MAG: pyridoxal 5'-phosphate synthase glutaminase subunit PdxT, partial [Actinobacteria bacterium]|nr:pyridoxal 5'-phosphate synthase glutaminase subunit PdxT [Actinomycetota bacterium]
MALVGVLALQGGFAAHARMLRSLGADVREVRVPGDLDGVDGLVIPGGESTTMTLGIEREGLAEPLRAFAGPIFGTCAGLIMLDRRHLAIMDIEAQRNAFGRQVRSFEADLDLAEIDGPPLRAVFNRAQIGLCAAGASAVLAWRPELTAWTVPLAVAAYHLVNWTLVAGAERSAETAFAYLPMHGALHDLSVRLDDNLGDPHRLTRLAAFVHMPKVGVHQQETVVARHHRSKSPAADLVAAVLAVAHLPPPVGQQFLLWRPHNIQCGAPGAPAIQRRADVDA